MEEDEVWHRHAADFLYLAQRAADELTGQSKADCPHETIGSLKESCTIGGTAMDITHQRRSSAPTRPELSHGARLRALRRVPLLAALPLEMRDNLARQMREVHFSAGETIVREGDAGDGLYLVVEGRAGVETAQSGDAVKLAMLEPGALFGELALLSEDHHRQATVTALTPVVALTLGVKQFRELEAGYPEMRRVIEAHAKREHVSKYMHTHVLYRCHFHDPRRELLFLTSVSFFVSFLVVRALVTSIRNHVGPFHNVQAGSTHIHHLVWGILLLIVVGYGFLLLANVSVREERTWHRVAAIVYGIGAALTLDEFALWLKLADVYFSPEGQKSIQVVIVFGAALMIGVWGGPFIRALYHHLIRRHPKSIAV